LKHHLWKDQALCLESDVNLYFDLYEEDLDVRKKVDSLCNKCPMAKKCFANGISGKEWGVWGGIYLENGEISKEFSNHRNKEQWGDLWKNLTIENENIKL
jgi:hypothetical protein